MPEQNRNYYKMQNANFSWIVNSQSEIEIKIEESALFIIHKIKRKKRRYINESPIYQTVMALKNEKLKISFKKL